VRRLKREFRGNHYERAQRRWLWTREPHCCYCGVLTVLPAKYDPDRPFDTMATVEHLDPRLSPERGKHPGKFRKVIACWKCNNERNRAFTASLPRQTLWEQSRQIYGIAKMAGALNEVDGWA
jgi:hypothetical protein